MLFASANENKLERREIFSDDHPAFLAEFESFLACEEASFFADNFGAATLEALFIFSL